MQPLSRRGTRSFGAALVACSLLLTCQVAGAQLVERPLITGRHGIVTSLDPLASMAGMKILMKGGNAFDAAVATAVAVAVVDPKDSTIGGQGFATIRVAKTGEVLALNFFGPAPKGATVKALEGRDYTEGYLATPVPSNVRGYQELHRKYGRLPWAEVLQPAIELAEGGFVVTEDFSHYVKEYEKTLSKYPATKDVFLPGGRVPQPNEIFVQKDLAWTLKTMAAEGADAFYSGPVARRIVDSYQKHGGMLTLDDLRSYQARWVKPISITYHGVTFYTPPPNSSGIALLLELNLLEGFDLKALGHNTPKYLHLVGEVIRLAAADRNRYVGDPDFVDVPVDRLLSKEYAASRRALVDLDKTIPVVRAGDLPIAGEKKRENTTHLTVVDAEGNMVSLTQTLGAWFGSGVVAEGTGVLFSNQMRHLHMDPASPSRVEPGKRPRSNQSPIIALKDGQPFLAIGTPGSDGIWQRMSQVIVNIVDFGMDIQTAITQPRVIFGDYQETGSALKPKLLVENRIPKETMDLLRATGYEIESVVEDEGRVNGVMINGRTHFLTGGADPRNMVYALGW